MPVKDVTPNSASSFNKINKIKEFSPRYLYLVLMIFLAIYYYLVLPPFHYASLDFWIFLAIALVGVFIIELFTDSSGWLQKIKNQNYQTLEIKGIKLPKKYRWFFIPIPLLLLLALAGHLIFSPLFISKQYANLIQPVTKDFKNEFPESNIDQIPLVDRDTAVRLGNRHLGALTDLVSQFEASEEYTQINIAAKPYRVTPLKYAGFFKWLNNFKDGIPHYLQVDNVTGKVEVKSPEQPIRYSFAEHLGRNIYRHLRFNYPFNIFGQPSFEVDDEGIPYYIATTYGRKFFLREAEPTGLVIVNAMTGDHQKYELDEVPGWVDRVYSADLIMHQLNLNGQYKNGFWNSLFAKEGVTEATEGYNYIPMNDDLYLYTGITSVVADDSNIGFVLVNLRTKESSMFPLSAAEEFSAMQSAEGSVQETGYKATFPLLINLQNKPMYILTLKDSSGLIKDYALVDVQNYQQVYVAPSLTQLMKQYAEDQPLDLESISQENLQELTGQVESIQAVVQDGQTMYYFMMDGKVYQAPLALNEFLPFVQEGQDINFTVDTEGSIYSVDLSKSFGDNADEEATVEETSETTVDPLIENVN